MDGLPFRGGMGRSARRRRLLMVWVLLAAACDDGEPDGGPEAATLAPAEPAQGDSTVTSAPNAETTTTPSSSGATADTAEATTAASDGEARVRATVVATWGGENSSWLLVDLADGETIEGSARVVVELDEPDVDCAGTRSPLYILSGPEEVTFELVPDMAAAGPPDVRDLRWAVPVAVAGRDLRIVCPSRDELTATIAAQRARWTAAGVRDYEFTLRWGIFNLTAGDYRVSVVDGQPGTLTRLDEPPLEPDAPPLDLSDIPTTIDEIFDRLESELGADRIVACYDSQLGYPVDVLVDQIVNGVDDELTMTISELTIAGSLTPSVGCTARTQSTMGSMACDVYVIGADGGIGTTPVRTGVRGFSTVARAELPDEVTAGEAFVVTVPSDAQILTSAAEQFGVVAHRDFLRVFGVTGGAIVVGSVSQTPAESAPATTDETTVSLGLTTAVAGGEEVTFPAARFEVVAGDTGTSVEVSLLRYESTLDLQNTDGSIITIRVSCVVDPNVLAVATVS